MTNRNPALDGLRAVAVCTVFAAHCNIPGFGGGGAAVDVFFVLSGFLITGLLLDREIKLSRFYLSRINRLTPTLILSLALASVLGISSLSITVSALYGMDYARALGFVAHDGLGHIWSLSVEEHFYLLWPLAIMALKRCKHKSAILAIMFLAATVWRDVNAVVWGYDFTYFRFDTRLSGLMLGSLAAMLIRSELNVNKWTLGVGSLGIVISGTAALFCSFELMALTLGVTVAEVCAVRVILCVRDASDPIARAMSGKAITYVGRISYGLYLFHYPITCAMEGMNPLVIVGVAAPITLGIAALSYRYIEIPVMKAS